MSTYRSRLESGLDRLQTSERGLNRLSVLSTPPGSPTVVVPRRTPVPSLRANISNSDIGVATSGLETDRRSPCTVIAAPSSRAESATSIYSEEKEVNTDITPLDPPEASFALQTSANSSTQAIKSNRSSLNAPSVFGTPSPANVALGDVYRNPRFSLLNEPNSFSSLRTSSRSSVASLQEEPNVEANGGNDMVVAAGQSARLNRPSLVERNRSLRDYRRSQSQNVNTFASNQPRTSHFIAEDLQALSIEQGGLPVRALASPSVRSPPKSAPSRIPPLIREFPLISEDAHENQVASANTLIPDPLRANPPQSKSGSLYRSATLPARNYKARKTTFLPTPIDPLPGRRFERQSIISTPYPHLGSMAEKQRESPRERIKASMAEQESKSINDCETPLVISIPDVQALNTKTGHIIIRKPRSASLQDDTGKDRGRSEIFDDAVLALAILREYRRLKGWSRFFFNARAFAKVIVFHKDSIADAPNKHKYRRHHLSPPDNFPFTADPSSALSVAEEGRASFTHPGSLKRPPFAATALAKRLETQLTILLHQPRSGAARTICVSNLWSLLEFQQPTQTSTSSAPQIQDSDLEPSFSSSSDPISLEMLESWEPKRILFAIATVLVLSVLVTLLWTLIGVGGAAQEVEVSVAALPAHQDGRVEAVLLEQGEGW